MRGARSCRSKSIAIPGIIPAYAGSTISKRCGIAKGKDHPRVCGEHDGMSYLEILQKGSSPRMRGAPLLRFPDVLNARIIPAYAGST